ncbi:MAG: outer rane autotransporter barrel domain protein, partial [Phycisphaerales bacterium]|nr:outer rane autotransporter barrel domain protein [Phycisphaerales bacterium]
MNRSLPPAARPAVVVRRPARQATDLMFPARLAAARPPVRAAVLGAAAFVAAAALWPSAAAAQTWTGASGTDLFWGTAGNWSPATVPNSATADAAFPSLSILASQTIDLQAAAFNVRSLTFNAADAYALTNGTLTFNTGGKVTQSGAGAVAIGAALNLNNVAVTFDGTGAGAVGLTGALSSTTPASGALTLNATGGTPYVLTVGGAASNTYTGNTTVTAGTLVLGKDAGLTAVAGKLVMNAAAGTARLAGADQTVGALEGNTAAATIDLNGRNLSVGTFNTGTTFAGNITGAGNLVKTAAGSSGAVQSLAGTARSYTGQTIIRNGGLTVTASVLPGVNGPLGNASSAVLLSDATTSASPDTNTTREILTIDAGASNQTMQFGRDIDASGAPTTALGRNRIQFTGSSSANSSTLTVSGAVNAGANRRLELTTVQPLELMNFTGPIGGTNANGILVNGSGSGTGGVRFGSSTSTFQNPLQVTNGTLFVGGSTANDSAAAGPLGRGSVTT